MKNILVTFILILTLNAGMAQNYNPAVNSGIMTPAPLINGVGECQFNVGNTGSDPLNNLSQPMVLIVSLSYGVPNNNNPVSAISGTYASKFNWLYDATTKTYQGTQNQIIPGFGLGSVKIAYQATTGSNASNPQNGFNVNVTPPAYTNTSNTGGDDNISSYTYGTVGGPLPIKLDYFNAVLIKCASILNWKSLTEDNFRTYEVEYSNDGITFNTVAKMNGKGSSSIYSFTYNAEQGKAYYRLKMINGNGTNEFSNITVLDISCGKSAVKVYPNPANNFLNVNITGTDNQFYTIQIFNSAGQALLSKTLQNATSQIDISNLASGFYTLTVNNNTGRESIKIIKK